MARNYGISLSITENELIDLLNKIPPDDVIASGDFFCTF